MTLRISIHFARRVGIGALIALAVLVPAGSYADYQYDRGIGGFWELSDRASTLDLKSDYLNKFVAAIEAERYSGYNAIFFRTPTNSYDGNLATLKSLQARMQEIRGMDPKSFEYQQAISQITAQEQGQAQDMLGVFEGLWMLKYWPILWDWIGTTIVTFLVLAAIAAGIAELIYRIDL